MTDLLKQLLHQYGLLYITIVEGEIRQYPCVSKGLLRYWIVIAGSMAFAACLLVPLAYVSGAWQLISLRFTMGLALGGLLPCITSLLRHSVPDRIAGSILGYLVSSQFAGLVVGPLLGGFVGGHLGMRAVFFATAVLLGLGAAGTRAMTPEEFKRPGQHAADPASPSQVCGLVQLGRGLSLQTANQQS
jgi:MFS family permease